MILVVDRRDSVLRHKSGCLVLECKGRPKRQIPIQPLEQVVVYGNAMVETSVWRALAATGTPLIMLAARGRPQAAMSGSGLATQLPLRRLQHRLADNVPKSLTMAKRFVRLKMHNYDLPLGALINGYQADRQAVEDLLQLRCQCHESIKAAPSLASVTGHEGRLAHAWFTLLGRCLPAHFNFSGRNRRPPRDPVNALLSLGYTLLLSEVRQCLLLSGFDPSLGFLHQDYPGRESLALDFTEIFRSGVDNFVLRWLQVNNIDRKGFYYRKDTGCRMSKKLRPRFYQAWAHYRESWPRPLAKPGQSSNIDQAPVRELINGEVTRARAFMKTLEEDNGKPAAGAGHVAEDIE